MAATGLSADPTNTAPGSHEQTDEQIDAWAAELMRDVANRRGVIRVVDDFRSAAPARASAISNGCSLPAVGRRRWSGATPRAAR